MLQDGPENAEREPSLKKKAGCMPVGRSGGGFVEQMNNESLWVAGKEEERKESLTLGKGVCGKPRLRLEIRHTNL